MYFEGFLKLKDDLLTSLAIMPLVILFLYSHDCVLTHCTASYLKLCMFMDVFSPLSAKDKFSFISHSNQVVLHSVTQQPKQKADRHRSSGILHTSIFTIPFY